MVAPALVCRATAIPTPHVTRRGHLLGSTLLLGSQLCPRPAPAAQLAPPITTPKPKLLADLPMLRIKLPEGGVGRDYAVLQLTIDGKGPYRFMVDSGLTAELITPHLSQQLRSLQELGKTAGLGAGGQTSPLSLVQLKGAALCCGDFPWDAAKQLPLPPLTAAVMDFPQSHMDPRMDPVEGMLGMEVLALFDTDLDFPKGRIRLWAPGSAALLAASQDLVELPAAVLNETGVLGIRAVASSASPPGASPPPGPAAQQPFVGIVDCGSSFSAINLQAAKLMGLPVAGAPGGGVRAVGQLARGPDVVALGIDGRPQALPTTQLAFDFKGEVSKGKDGRLVFEPPPPGWRPWSPVLAAVGDIAVFGQLLGDGREPFKGPAALIGLDVLAQRRLMLEALPVPQAGPEGQGRRRRLFVGRS